MTERVGPSPPPKGTARVTGLTVSAADWRCHRWALVPAPLSTRNMGNLFSQSVVIAVLALPALLAITTPGVDFAGSTLAWFAVLLTTSLHIGQPGRPSCPNLGAKHRGDDINVEK
jgi:ribose/xylose/arabinose/galactoside ABC-type transport system permease subunit